MVFSSKYGVSGSTSLCFCLIVCFTQASHASGAVFPFLSASDAKTVLGQGDLGRLRGLTTQLGLRSDISDGWEELYIISPSNKKRAPKDVTSQLLVALQRNYVPQAALSALIHKVALGSVVGLRSPSMLGNPTALSNSPKQVGGEMFANTMCEVAVLSGLVDLPVASSERLASPNGDGAFGVGRSSNSNSNSSPLPDQPAPSANLDGLRLVEASRKDGRMTSTEPSTRSSRLSQHRV